MAPGTSIAAVGNDYARGLQGAFGQVVRERRIKAGLTQEALAERAELTRNYVSDLERGLKSPTLSTVSALALAFGTKTYLLVQAAEARV